MATFKDRTGERFKNRDDLGGYEFVIVEYNKRSDVWVEFQDEHKARVHTEYKHCKNGGVKNPYHPSVRGIGYVGIGKYVPTINNKMTDEYNDWKHMIKRCYDINYLEQHSTYKNVYVCRRWHNFQNFAEWWHNNYYEIEGEQMCLDKDILIKGNKEYAPDKCIFVPQRINTLFVKNDMNRGNLPIGVSYCKQNGKYHARCRVTDKINGRKEIHLGYYNTPYEAFLAYKQFKEAYLKQVADEYKDKIPQRLYDAMYNWIVEEDD